MVPEQDVLTISSVWGQLDRRAAEEKQKHLADWFDADETRFERFSLRDCGLLADYSKQRL